MKKLLPALTLGLAVCVGLLAVGSTQPSNGDVKLHWQNGSKSIEVRVRGEVEFTEDDRDVKTLSPYGLFSLKESRWWLSSRRYQVTADSSGKLTRTYFVDGESKPFDAEGRAWVAQAMPEIIRETGVGAARRVQRLLRERGPSGVLADIRLIHSDESKRTYLEELIRNGNLDPEGLRSAMVQARKIGADDEKSNLLLAVSSAYLRDDLRDSLFGVADTIASDDEHQHVLSELIGQDPTDTETLRLALRSAAKISSDDEKATILTTVAEHYKGHEAIRWAYFKAANSISSDDEHHRVLSAILKSDGDDRETLVDVLRSDARISADDEKAAVLVEASRYYSENDAVRDAYFDAANTISSDDEHRKALAELLQKHGLQSATLAETAKSARRISSDDEKSEVLSELAAQDIQDATVRSAFFDAVNSISSDEERARVFSTLSRRAGPANGTLSEVLESASRISSDEEKAKVLVEMGKMDLQNEASQATYFKATDSISSDDEHARVLTSLLRRHDLPTEAVTGVIQSATHISSDDAKVEVFKQVMDSYSGDPVVRARLRGALESLQSNDQYRELMSNLRKQESGQ